nr:amino acid ABC transporter permease [Gammaproteobacteria bacterium]
MRTDATQAVDEALPVGPPRITLSAVGWMRQNLFNSWYNTILTFVALWLIYLVLSSVISWGII